MARLDRLGSAKEVAQIGSAIGREFSHTLLSAVVSKPEPELASALDRLIVAGLLFRQGVAPHATYLFKHALVQDAAYGTLLRGQRQQLHGRVAKALESRFSEIKETQPETLAQHYAHAGLNEQALKFWLVAGDLAERRAMGREAVAHYRAARALLHLPGLSDDARASEPTLLTKLGSALQQIEGYNSAHALDAYKDARAAALKLDQLEAHADASIGMCPCLFARCRYREALKIGDEISATSID
jgi:predicted ATPase